MKDQKNVRSRLARVYLWVCVLGISTFSLGAAAQAVPATATGSVHPLSLGGNTYTFGGAQATAANAAKYSYAPAANGAIYTTNVASIPGASGGAAVPVTVNGSISKTAAAAAIGKFVLRATGVIGVLQVGVGLYDLAKELGFTLSDNGGVLGVSQVDPTICTVSPCYGYKGLDFYTGQLSTTVSASVSSAATLSVSTCNGWSANYICSLGAVRAAGFDLVFSTKSNNQYSHTSSYGVSSVSVPPAPVQSVPSTPQAFTDAVAAKPVWPPESAIARAVRDAVKSGESVAVEPVSVTGPATSPGPRTVTNNGTSTTTNQTTNNYNYAGNTVSVTNVTTSSTVNNTSGATEAVTTTTTEPVVEPEPEDVPDPCVENPTRAGCVDIGDAPTPEVMSKVNHAVSVTAASFASSNGCPPPISMVALGRTYALSYEPICDRLVYVKVLFLAMAGVGAAFILSNSFKV